jgi:hypothetical protein
MSDAAIFAELRRLAEAVERNTEVLEVIASRGRLSKEDRRTLAELLPVVGAIVGDSAFTCADLFEQPTLRPLLADQTLRGLPWLLARANGAPHGGFRVVRIGRDRDGALWRVRRDRAAQAGERVP